VATDQEFPPILEQPAPSFADTANRPGMTAKSIPRPRPHYALGYQDDSDDDAGYDE
jgi:hypothetical protein